MVGVKCIIKKELTRVFTDKKLIFSLFIMPAILMIVMYGIMGKLLTNMITDIDTHVPSIVVQNAPDELDEIIKATEFSGDIIYIGQEESLSEEKASVLAGDIDLIIVFEENFMEFINKYKSAGDFIPEIKTYYNPAEDYSEMARSKFMSIVLSSYEQSILAKRLGNMEILQVFKVDVDPETSIIVDEKKADGKFLSMMVPFLVNILLFSGAMGLGVDAITGEKERGTLSSMLLAPIKRSEIVFGKLLSLAILSIISAAVYVISIITAVPLLAKGLSETGEVPIIAMHFTVIDVVQLFVILMFVVYLYVAMIAFVSVIAKTVKEANTYVMPAYIIVMIGSIMTMYSTGADKALKYYAIPVYNSSICMQNIMMGELTLPKFLLTIGSTFVISGILTMLITKAFNSEKVMFNA